MTTIADANGNQTLVTYRTTTLTDLQISAIQESSYDTIYTYDGDGRPLTTTLSNGKIVTNTYDAIGRLTQKRIGLTSNYDTSLTYLAGANGSQTALLATYRNGSDSAYSYTYDENGNILTITQGTAITYYQYDAANQLIREDNASLNQSWTYSYDSWGNLQSKSRYAYVANGGTLGSCLETLSYTYGNSTWADQLTSYNGQFIAYDAMGNPTSYLGKTLSWEGKQLTGITATGQSVSYAYDENGLRTQKTVDGTTTNYYYNGSVLIGMVTGSGASAIVQRFSYDSSGSVVSVDYSSNNGSAFTTYYYLRNGRGDVVKLIDSTGTTKVQYTYDSWGKLIATTGTLSNTVGLNNPFRYRGYVYDTETGWYYLQSRYYDPGVSRFISSDVLLSTGQGVLGHNSYAYCLNNPANMSDSCGSRPNFCVSMTDGGGGSSSSTSEPTPTPTPTPYPGPGPEHKVFSSRGVNLNKVDIRIIERLIAMADAYGVDRILFTSGYRTHSKQKTLYDTYMQDPEHNNLALAPYTSWHEYGGAVDIDCPILEGLTNEDFAKFGLSRPWYDPNNSKLNETWHIQLLENSSQSTNNYDGNTYYSGITTWG